jgi:hypothetical protein
MYRIKLAYSGHQGLPTRSDAMASGLPVLRVLINAPPSQIF